MSEILTLNAGQLVVGFRQRSLSPVEVMCAVLDRVTKLDPVVNAFCALDEEGAMSAAGEAERRWMRGEPCGPLDGVPVSVKDLVAVAGLPTRHGSRTASPDREYADAPAVARLRRAGAIPFGKTTTSEFGNKIVTDCPLTGATRNPWDTRLSPGGSSGGSAVAVALGMGPLSLATDGGGSIRIPACWSGVVGFKPTFALVPAGNTASWTALSTLGPIARTVRDAALMLDAVTWANDDRPPGAGSPSGYCDALDNGVAGLRVAWCPSRTVCRWRQKSRSVSRGQRAYLVHSARRSVRPMSGRLRTTTAMAACIRSVVRVLRAASPAYGGGGQDTARSRSEGTGGCWSTGGHRNVCRCTACPSRTRRIDGNVLRPLRPAAHTDVSLRATSGSRSARPSASGTRPDSVVQPGWRACDIRTVRIRGGMPVGLQIIGRRGSDALVLRAARAYELARGNFRHRVPNCRTRATRRSRHERRDHADCAPSR